MVRIKKTCAMQRLCGPSCEAKQSEEHNVAWGIYCEYTILAACTWHCSCKLRPKSYSDKLRRFALVPSEHIVCCKRPGSVFVRFCVWKHLLSTFLVRMLYLPFVCMLMAALTENDSRCIPYPAGWWLFCCLRTIHKQTTKSIVIQWISLVSRQLRTRILWPWS